MSGYGIMLDLAFAALHGFGVGVMDNASLSMFLRVLRYRASNAKDSPEAHFLMLYFLVDLHYCKPPGTVVVPLSQSLVGSLIIDSVVCSLLCTKLVSLTARINLNVLCGCGFGKLIKGT
jgi:hypothetical protein